MISRNLLVPSRLFLAAAFVAILLVSNASQCLAQQLPTLAEPPQQNKALPDVPVPQPEATTGFGETSIQGPNTNANQSKRILWIFPNYRAVSADTQLPPLSLREKFWLATQDSFDYSSFITTAMLAGISQAKNSYPEFGHHAAAYGRYYWHAQADLAVGNYLTEAIVPSNARRPPILYARTRRILQTHWLRCKPSVHHAYGLRRSKHQYFGTFRKWRRRGNIRRILPLKRAHLDEDRPKVGDPNRVGWRVQHRERVLA